MGTNTPVRVAAIAVATLIVGACSSPTTTVTTPPATSIPPSSTVETAPSGADPAQPITPQQPGTSSTRESEETPTTPSLPAPASTIPHPPTVPDLLLAHSGGISQVGSGISWLTGDSIAIAFPDLAGGVLFQREGHPPGPIEHLAFPGGAPSTVIPAGPVDRLSMVDVFEIDGAPTLAYRNATQLPNDCREEDAECTWDYEITYLMLHDLALGVNRNLGIVGSFESGWHSYRFGDDGYGSMWSEYGSESGCIGWGPFDELTAGISPDGWLSAEARCRRPPPQICSGPEMTCGTPRVAVAANGSAVVYAAGGRSRPLEVTVVDFFSGRTVRQIEVETGEFYVPGPIEVLGEWIVVSRRAGDWTQMSAIVIGPDGSIEYLERTGTVTFWRGGSPP